MSEFIWTDELVREFIEFESGKILSIEGEISEFKQSKQQPLEKEKDWEIVEGFKPEYGSERIDIFSVRRLSDNEVFSIDEEIGDRIGDYFGNKIIEKFIPYNGKMYVTIKDNSGIFLLIDIVKKRQQPLFTTYDNQPIYNPNQKVWIVESDWTCKEHTSEIALEYVGKGKIFASEDEAEKYVGKHKPKYSEEDLREAFEAARKYSRDGYDYNLLKHGHLIIQHLNHI